MNRGDLVKTRSGRLGIIKAYYPEYDNGSCYPYYVYMMDCEWEVEYFMTGWLELVSECG